MKRPDYFLQLTINQYLFQSSNKVSKVITSLLLSLSILLFTSSLHASLLTDNSHLCDESKMDDQLRKPNILIESLNSSHLSEAFEKTEIGKLLLVDFKKMYNKANEAYHRSKKVLDDAFLKKISESDNLLEDFQELHKKYNQARKLLWVDLAEQKEALISHFLHSKQTYGYVLIDFAMKQKSVNQEEVKLPNQQRKRGKFKKK